MKKKIVIIVVLMFLFFNQVFLTANDGNEKEAKIRASLFAGLSLSFVQDIGDNRAGFTYGADISYRFLNNISAVFKFNKLSIKNKYLYGGTWSWKQSFVNLGIRTKLLKQIDVGGGISFSSVETLNSTGAYAEIVYNKKNIFSNVKFDLVNLDGISVSALVFCVGYSFNIL